MGAIARYGERLRSEWEANIGPEATKIRWLQVRLQLLSWFLGAVALVPGFIAASAHGSVRTLCIWLVVGLFGVVAIGLGAMFYELFRWRNASRLWRRQFGPQ